jgi:hypothetical protein
MEEREADQWGCSFISYRTSQYQLHFYETPTNIKFVMLTDLKSPSMRIALQQIYVNLYVEYGRLLPYTLYVLRACILMSHTLQ